MVPFLVAGMPKQAVLSDNVNVCCFGACGFLPLNAATGLDSTNHEPKKEDVSDTAVHQMLQAMDCDSDDSAPGEAGSKDSTQEGGSIKDPVGDAGSNDSAGKHRVWTFARPVAYQVTLTNVGTASVPDSGLFGVPHHMPATQPARVFTTPRQHSFPLSRAAALPFARPLSFLPVGVPARNALPHLSAPPPRPLARQSLLFPGPKGNPLCRPLVSRLPGVSGGRATDRGHEQGQGSYREGAGTCTGIGPWTSRAWALTGAGPGHGQTASRRWTGNGTITGVALCIQFCKHHGESE